MRLVLAVDPPRDLVVEVATPDAQLADVLAAAGIVVDPGDAWWVDGTRVDVATPLPDVVVTDGTVLAPAPTRPVLRHAVDSRTCSTPDGAVVTVVAGNGSGSRREAPPGRAVEVGRDDRAAIRLDSDTVSARHLRLVATDHDVLVEDHGSRNGTWVDGHALPPHEPTRFDLPVTLRVGACVLRVASATGCDRPVGLRDRDVDGRWSVDRPPRSARPGPVAPVDVPAPPEAGSRARALRWAAVVAPMAMGGAMIAMTGQLRFALFALLSPVMAVATWWSDRRRDRGDRRATGATWEAAVNGFRSDLESARLSTGARLEAVHPDLGEVIRQATEPSTRLWERRPADPDALAVRVGSADRLVDLPLRRHDDGDPADVGRSEQDQARHTQLADLVAEHRRLPTSPVPVALDRTPVVGLVGHRPTALALARALLVQLATFHGPADLPLAVLVAPDHRDDWDWAKWLPHVEVDGRRLVAADRGAAIDVVAALAARHAASGRGDPDAGPTTGLVVDDVGLVTGPAAPVRGLLRPEAGTVVAFVLAEHADRLPASCEVVITCHDDATATVAEPAAATDDDPDLLLPATLDRPAATSVARALAHLLDPERPRNASALPTIVPLSDLLDPATGAREGDIGPPGLRGDDGQGVGPGRADHRDPTDGGTRLAAPLGREAGGTTWIDLVADGPHALVGGTTGSGKSELLRSLVAGLAARHTPDQVVFVLVDYKGGAAFRECAELPHTVGLVTDLDDHLGARALTSLDAELRHREQVLARAGADDLPGYVAGGCPDGPLPRLVVVIDEFATLAAELPGFLDALVGVAQRGRSLGVHLVLATQRPRGSVDANVKANTNLRIALRVQDDTDSMDIVDEAVAAEIPRRLPGRAWVRRGHGDLVAVQTALATSPRRGTVAPVRVAPFRFAPTSPLPDATTEDEVPTDLSTVVGAATARHRASGGREPRRPWLPMLATDLPLVDLVSSDDGDDPSVRSGGVVMGMVDLPREQAQRVTRWDLGASALTAVWPVGSGTTTVLCTVAASAALANGPDDLHLYGIDAGGGGLSHLRDLPHAGAVLGIDQVDDHAHLLAWLAGEVRRRQALAAPEREALPRLLLLLDNLAGFLAVHDGRASREVVDHLATVLDDGPPMRVAAAVATERVAGLSGALRTGLGRRLVLGHPDDRDLSLVGLRRDDLPPPVPGRALDATTGDVLQVARVAELGDLPALVAARVGSTAGRRPPHRIHGLPERVDLSSLPAPTGPRPLLLPIGMGRAGQPRSLVLYPGDHVTIAGPSRSGRTTALQVLSARLREVLPDAIQVALCDADRSALHGWPSLDAAGSAAGLARVLAAGATRGDPWFVLVDDVRWCGDDDLLADLVAARADLHLVVTGRPDEVRGGFGAWQRTLRTSETGILLQPDLALDGDLLGTTLPRHLRTAIGPGRGFVVNAGEAELVQFADAPCEPPRGSIGM